MVKIKNKAQLFKFLSISLLRENHSQNIYLGRQKGGNKLYIQDFIPQVVETSIMISDTSVQQEVLLFFCYLYIKLLSQWAILILVSVFCTACFLNIYKVTYRSLLIYNGLTSGKVESTCLLSDPSPHWYASPGSTVL